MSAHLDKIDLHILRLLQKDGRITNLQLSNEVGLSPAPTLERVRKPENNGYIKSFLAAANEEDLGFGIQTFIQSQDHLHQPDSRKHFIMKTPAKDALWE